MVCPWLLVIPQKNGKILKKITKFLFILNITKKQIYQMYSELFIFSKWTQCKRIVQYWDEKTRKWNLSFLPWYINWNHSVQRIWAVVSCSYNVMACLGEFLIVEQFLTTTLYRKPRTTAEVKDQCPLSRF